MASITATNAIEEETYDDYVAEEFYPARIGEVIKSSGEEYEIIGKLGFGRHSTVWLCRERGDDKFYTLKLTISHHPHTTNREADIYTLIQSLPPSPHAGRAHVRELREAFEIQGPEGRHWCLVHPVLGLSVQEWLEGFEGGRVPVGVMKGLVRCLLEALDFLHEEAGVIHTDIQASNIHLALSSTSPIDSFVAAEKDHPSPHKTVDSQRTIYRSRRLSVALDPEPGVPTLTDFGLAVRDAHVPHAGLIQPLLFRAPEVILRMPWDWRADVWNLGVLMWQLMFNQHLFDGETEGEQLRGMVASLGPPPPEFVLQGRLGVRELYFDDDGVWRGDPITPDPLGESLEGEEAGEFLDLLMGMVRWVPGERKSARELLGHPWLAVGGDGAGEEAGRE
ncbi:CMGC/SRPK protein kinase [Pseudogymnoascus sp. 23342-1-I1]|nr:CMGC/SRPK protein kinase [Pseudogymnoascus sp. 23342-1-I1]